jgi:hypothetical protein
MDGRMVYVLGTELHCEVKIVVDGGIDTYTRVRILKPPNRILSADTPEALRIRNFLLVGHHAAPSHRN